MTKVSAFAPATIANVGPGFDCLGLAINGIGDVVEAELTSEFAGVRLVGIVNNPGLPVGPENVVEAVGNKVYAASLKVKPGKEVGIELTLHKNMGIGTGMGSSASSSVAAAMAVNKILGMYTGIRGGLYTETPEGLVHRETREYVRASSGLDSSGFFKRDSRVMIDAVVEGEYVACGSRHADNVLPSLLGGLILIYDTKKFEYMRFEVPDSIYLAVVQPDLRVDTKDAREALKVPYDLGELVRVSGMCLKSWAENNFGDSDISDIAKILKPGGSENVVLRYLDGAHDVLYGLINADADLLGGGVMTDRIITPKRGELITGYKEVAKAFLEGGALGCSISGSGSAMFAVADSVKNATNAGLMAQKTWKGLGIESKMYVSRVNNTGATVQLF